MQAPIRIELPIPFAVGPVNAILIPGPEPVLVDTGLKLPDCQAALEKGLAEQGLNMEDLKKIVITHAHVDHAGMAAYLAKRSGAEVWVNELSYQWIADLPKMWDERIDILDRVTKLGGLPDELRQKGNASMRGITAMWESVPEKYLRRFPINGTIEMGGADWQVIYAPGHTITQTCFYQPEQKWLISADMLLHKAPTPVIDADENGKRVRGLPKFMEMLDQFEAMEISITYPGHGDLIHDHREVIQRQRARIEMRKNEVLDLVAAGHKTIQEITNVMYAHYPLAARSSGFGMVIGYLDLLMDEEAVRRETVDGVWHFSKPA